MVINSSDSNGIIVFQRAFFAALNKTLDRAISANLVIKSGTENELLKSATQARWLRIDNTQLNVVDVVNTAPDLFAYHVNQYWMMLVRLLRVLLWIECRCGLAS